MMDLFADSIRELLSNEPTQDKIKEFVYKFKAQNVKPQAYLHKVDLSKQKTPLLLYATLMVQDIRENYYYYPLFVRRPFNKNSKFHAAKYGNQSEEIYDYLDDDEYAKIIMDRQVITCTAIHYETQWMKKLKDQDQMPQKIQVIIDGKCEFKLGQVFHSVCIWDPSVKQLFYVRAVDSIQAKEVNLDPWNKLLQSTKINYTEKREKIIKIFGCISSEKYSLYLLYSLISNECLFISGENIQQIIRQMLPRVNHLQIKAPFHNSLFPYKNQDNQLISAPMQMSTLDTYVILDFSQLANQEAVKIQQAEIDNLKALKVFVEQGNTIYRWEYGESLVKHSHCGLIVKGSKIVNPHYNLSQEKINIILNPLQNITEQEKMELRIYIGQIKKLQPILGQNARLEIQKNLKINLPTYKDKLKIKQIMQLSKLNAMTNGRQQILYQDYQIAWSLIHH